MTNFDVIREFESGLSEQELAGAVERSSDAIEEMREEGTVISYLGSEVFVDEDGLGWMTICRYDADDEETIRDHSERATLPVRKVLFRGTPLAGIAPRSGVVPQAA